jgi:hypothetical protein
MQVQQALHLLLCTRQVILDFMPEKKAISFPDSLLVFDSSSCSGLQTLVEGEVPAIVEAKNDTPFGRKIAQATACIRKVSPHYGCVVARSYVQKRQLGCLRATGALTTTSKNHDR